MARELPLAIAAGVAGAALGYVWARRGAARGTSRSGAAITLGNTPPLPPAALPASGAASATGEAFEKVLPNVGVPCWLLDRHGRIHFPNTAAQKLLGKVTAGAALAETSLASEVTARLLDGCRETVAPSAPAQAIPTGAGDGAPLLIFFFPLVDRGPNGLSGLCIAVPPGAAGALTGTPAVAPATQPTSPTPSPTPAGASGKSFTEARHMDALGRLAAGIAHEFNNLLAPLVIDVERLASEAGEPQRVFAHINSLRLALAHARERTERTLLLGGELPEARDWIDLNDLVHSTLLPLRDGLDPRIHVAVTLAPTLNRLLLSRVGVVTILTQLIFNARDSFPALLNGGAPSGWKPMISIETRRVEAVNPTSEVRARSVYQVIAVRDNGVALSSEAKAHVFEPFFAPHSPRASHGLGLHLVWRLAQNHGGWVSVWSEEGEGSEFQVFMPELPNRPSAQAPTPAAQPSKAPPPKKWGVLLVEDNFLVANALAGVLEDRGFQVFFAENGERGWSTYCDKRKDIHVILSDLNLPGISGRDLLRKIRQASFDTPFLVLSGHIGSSEASELTELGVGGMITKPVNPTELIEAVTRALSRV